MTCHDYCNGLDLIDQFDSSSEGGFEQILELLIEHGFDGMAHPGATVSSRLRPQGGLATA